MVKETTKPEKKRLVMRNAVRDGVKQCQRLFWMSSSLSKRAGPPETRIKELDFPRGEGR